MSSRSTKVPIVHSRTALLSLVGAIMIAVGIAGMVIVGIEIRGALGNPSVWQTQDFWFQMKEYAFMFTMIGGVVILLYSLVRLQRKRAKRIGNA